MSELPRRADAVVVGGGITGSAVAYHLATRDANVVLLERAGIASGPTGRSTAIVRQHYSQPLLVQLAVHGLRVYAGFERETGQPSGFQRSGMLWLVGPADRPALEANVALARAAGAELELVEPGDLGQIDGRISPDGLAGACYEPEAGYADPYLAAAGYVEGARALGATIVEGMTVEHVAPGRVETASGALETEAVVVAAGPWSSALLDPLGYHLPISPARAEVGRYRLPAGFGPAPPALAELSPHQVYARPADPGYLEVGTLDPAHAAEPIEPDACPEGAERETLDAYARVLAHRVPALVGGHWRGSWSGVYDVTPDWQPAIGPVPGAEGVYVAAGFSGHGFKLAPAVGLALAGRVAGATWERFDLSLFDPGRFARGALIESRYGYSVVS